MPRQGTFSADYRRRNLVWLAMAALVSVLLAIFAITHQAAKLSPKYSPAPFFPGLATHVRDIARIRVLSKKTAFDLVRGRDGSWSVLQRASYPASFEQVQKLLVGFAGLETIEPKTSRPEWFHYVNLDVPPKGNGTLIGVSDAKGHTIAAAIFGTTEDIGDPGGGIGLFARKPHDNQSWLVRSVFEPKSDPGDWMDKSVVNVDRERIQEVDVKPASGAAYVARRNKPGDPDFKLLNLPSGREPSSEAAADGLASALTGFTFNDVLPVGQLDFSSAARITTKTFDGLVVTANVIQTGQGYWARLSAEADSSHPDAQKEAREITARAGPWAYKLPADKGQQFMATLESLLKPVGTPAKTEQ
jgi:hypothetical protein